MSAQRIASHRLHALSICMTFLIMSSSSSPLSLWESECAKPHVGDAWSGLSPRNLAITITAIAPASPLTTARWYRRRYDCIADIIVICHGPGKYNWLFKREKYRTVLYVRSPDKIM